MSQLPTQSVNTCLQAALDYAQRGWRVLPVHAAAKNPDTGEVLCTCGSSTCSSPGKHPVPTNGVYAGTTDPNIIRQWWADMPLANVAIVCGKESGIVVLDIDPRNGGIESLKRLDRAPQSLYAKTGGGGLHVFFKYRDGIRYPKTIGAGLDIRSDDTYVVASPSSHVSGGSYQWGNPGDSLAEIDWLYEQIKKTTKGNGHSAPTEDAQKSDKIESDYAKHVLELAVAAVQVSDKGTRNETLNREAYSLGGLVGAGLLESDEVRERLQRAAQAAGLEPGEIASTLGRSLQDGISKPRAVETLESTQQMYLARKLCEGYGDLTVYDLDTERYWSYQENGGLWVECVDYMAEQTLMRMHGMPAVGPKGPTRLNVTHALIKAVNELVKRMIGKERFFDRAGVGVPFKNGVVDVDGRIANHSPHNRFTRGFDFEYRPDARCPMWLRTIERLLPNPEDRETLQEMFGATMFRLTSRYQKGFILYGTGANGKSLVCNILQGLMPEDTVVSVAPHSFKKAFHLGQLRHAWLNVVTEIYRTELRETETLKAVISGDAITAEAKYRPVFRFIPRVSCVFAANTLPVVTDQTEGLWRKLIVLPFEAYIPTEEQDDTLGDRLLRLEREGICAWAVAGAMRVLSRNQIKEPSSSVALKAQWRMESDQVQVFLASCVMEGWTSAIDLYSQYRGWAIQHGHSPLSSTRFGRRLKSLKVAYKRQSKRVMYNVSTS